MAPSMWSEGPAPGHPIRSSGCRVFLRARIVLLAPPTADWSSDQAFEELAMRAEIAHLVPEIEQGLTLLRRRL